MAQKVGWQKLLSEAIGTCMLLMAVVGSGVMAQELAPGQPALILLCNALATSCMLVVLILIFGPLSGAHFNPAVTLASMLRGDQTSTGGLLYIACQVMGGCLGVLLTHLMFELPLVSFPVVERTGSGQVVAEIIATFGLVLTILATLRYGTRTVAASVGLFIFAAYWFTSSTSFANPAVTISRALTDSFTGIRLQDVPPFVVAQLAGAIVAYTLWRSVHAKADSPADN